MVTWTTSHIPPQHGRTAVVTGAGGLGFQSALGLASAGANVIIAGRNSDKGQAAVNRIRQIYPSAKVYFEVLDLTDLSSVEGFSKRLRSGWSSIDLLINNAAVMAPPERLETVDGFELQLGTNYLGHFALTAKLLPLLVKGNAPRVVNLSSIAARNGIIHINDLQSEHQYKPMTAYAQSKLACLMFSLELQRRSDIAGWGIQSVASHPGISRTALIPNGSGFWSAAGIIRHFFWFLFQPAAQGALPILFAATSPQAQAGMYYGPDKLSETRGNPALAKIPPQAYETEIASRLWMASEQLTGVTFSNEQC
ncbi:NAD(P)-dependent dehydrogenase (short-subunit alcohol dehydrogenase family) [Rheinheimera pacifica]|uniref:SDR family oxidoreductase n=1 Tax=Rheinheimera pacifica TaxID=173990 RepID=UPI002866DA86|nr:SDR family oxidoreductase [Rheinheimera pacifica]MDR6984252.1 NAD(P)-dependent dehydrogenase (short-subunit alcohol dehydrogenase family) [Rheinheimera pacifica]